MLFANCQARAVSAVAVAYGNSWLESQRATVAAMVGNSARLSSLENRELVPILLIRYPFGDGSSMIAIMDICVLGEDVAEEPIFGHSFELGGFVEVLVCECSDPVNELPMYCGGSGENV